MRRASGSAVPPYPCVGHPAVDDLHGNERSAKRPSADWSHMGVWSHQAKGSRGDSHTQTWDPFPLRGPIPGGTTPTPALLRTRNASPHGERIRVSNTSRASGVDQAGPYRRFRCGSTDLAGWEAVGGQRPLWNALRKIRSMYRHRDERSWSIRYAPTWVSCSTLAAGRPARPVVQVVVEFSAW